MRKLTTQQFIDIANIKHNNLYDYLSVKYVNSRTKIIITCKKHGSFKQMPTIHLRGSGCPICSGKLGLNTKKFIERANFIHNNEYDYSLVKYVNNKTKINIICNKHGKFNTTPKNHLQGSKCPKCKNNRLSVERLMNINEFINKATIVHDEKYDYSMVIYKNLITKVKIICKKHGEFEQTASHHLQGSGCPKCNKELMADKFRLNINKFIDKSNIMHNKIYDYSNVIYSNHMSKVKIICKKHGEFEQTPNSHLKGSGCPICKNSKGEIKIREYLLKRNFVFESQKKFIECKNVLLLAFDFYLPNQNLLIEYDGKQHFEPVKIFGGENGFLKCKNNDDLKNVFAKKNQIDLIRIPYYNYINIENILNKHLND